MIREIAEKLEGYWLLVAVTCIAFWAWPKIGWGAAVIMGYCIWRLHNRTKLYWHTIFILLLVFLAGSALLIRNQQYQKKLPNTLTLKLDPYECHDKANGFISGVARDSQNNQAYWLNLKSFLSKQRFNQHQWQIVVKVNDHEPLAGSRNQGGFSFQSWGRTKGVTTQISGETISFRPLMDEGWYWQYWRLLAMNRLETVPRLIKFHIMGLIFGQLPESERDLTANLTQLGIVHLFALSGAQVTLFSVTLRRLLLKLTLPAELVDGMLIILLPAYACFVGSPVGIVRAVSCEVLRLVTHYLPFNLGYFDRVAFSALGQIIICPTAFFLPGVQLSYLLAISQVDQALLRPLQRWQQNSQAFLVSFPVLLYHFGTVNPISIFINWAIIPLFDCLIVPLTWGSLVIALLGWSWNWTIYEAALSELYRFLKFMACYSQEWIIGQPCWWWIILFLIGWLAINHLQQRKKRYCLMISMSLLLMSLTWLFNQKPWLDQVIMIDVGQGDSLLIRAGFPKKNILIDTGGRLNFGTPIKKISNFERETWPYLKRQGINRLDALILSHQDADHIGDLAAALKLLPVKDLIYGQGLLQNRQVQRKIMYFSGNLVPLKQGQSYDVGAVKLNCLAPDHAGPGRNEDSLVIEVTLQQRRWLFTGDLPITEEKKLLRQRRVSTIDYLKLGHHGSRLSSSTAFLKQLNPRAVFISAGVHNRYQHPHPETLARLRQLKIPYLCTRDYGMINWSINRWSHTESITTYLQKEER